MYAAELSQKPTPTLTRSVQLKFAVLNEKLSTKRVQLTIEVHKASFHAEIELTQHETSIIEK